MRAVTSEMWFSSGVTSNAAPLIDYLRQLQAHGETHVNVDDEARVLLREFYKRSMGMALSPAAVAPAALSDSELLSTVPQSQVPANNPAESTIQVVPVGIVVSGGSAEEKMASLQEQAKGWVEAKSLTGLRNTMVFSTGNLDADIMLVAEAPGYDEERLQEPFVGKAGQKLNAILRAMGSDRKDVYLTNVVKFRPSMPNQTTTNRKLTADELASWLPFIQEEVKIVQPKVIIALGAASAQALSGVDQPVVEMRGQFHQFDGIPLRVTYHPSYILNDESTPEKRMLWLDMLSVMEMLGMPVSDKQRGYFAKHES